MIQGLLGTKIGMTRWFDADGNSYGVTLIACGPCYVVEKDGKKIRLGYKEVKESKLTKSELGFLKKKDLPALKFQKVVDWYGKEEEQPAVGEKLTVNAFEIGEKLNIQGTSKGKGFAGVMKRWGFGGGPGGHGSRFHRAPGSIGQAASPSRVFPGLKMAGRMGSDSVTLKNIEVMDIDTDENIIIVKGAVPGSKKGLLFLQRNVKL
jgi:large subunit ribosomal protein L3